MFRSARGLSVAFLLTSAAAPQRDACKPELPLAALADVHEASGLAVSRRHPDRLWAHNDSGEPVLFAVDEHGTTKGRVRLTGAKVRDWEDIAVAPCPAGSCLYVADIGDNHPSRGEVTIYRVPEPAAGDAETKPAEALHAVYPDGPHDAEGLFVTPRAEIFLVTKENPAVVYRVPSGVSAGTRAKLDRVATLQKIDGRITGAAASEDGRWVAMRTHKAVLFFSLPELVAGRPGQPVEVDVTSLGEPQGEGVAFGAGGALYLVGEGGNKRRAGTLARLNCRLPLPSDR